MARRRTTNSQVPEPSLELPEPELVVIVSPDAGVRSTPDGLAAANADTKPIETAIGARASMVPLFGVSEDRLRNEASSVAAYTGESVPDLSVYYRVEAPGRDLDKLAAALAGTEAVVAAYVKPPAEPRS